MGFQLGPKLLRRAPKGWLPARAFAVEHSVYTHHDSDPDGGERVLETSAGLTVTWRVEREGRAAYEVSEERSAPAWLLSAPMGAGNRWYKVRLRPTYGLMPRIGVPCRVDPADEGALWVDWDAAYDEHVEAWEQRARVEREIARREGLWDYGFERVFNPFAGKLRAGDEQALEEQLARNAARERTMLEQSRRLAAEQGVGSGIGPAPPGEAPELRRRIEELRRIHAEGREAIATIVAREDTDRTFANVPLILLTFELEDGDGTRRVVFEHVYGPRLASRYTVGQRVEVRIDPRDPDAICPGNVARRRRGRK